MKSISRKTLQPTTLVFESMLFCGFNMDYKEDT